MVRGVATLRAVISQSMYFPWVGLLEQVRLADVFVHYDDVQFARGFLNRVQVKTDAGARWLTVPLRRHGRDEPIDALVVDDTQDWRQDHRRQLVQAYHGCPHVDDMLAVFDSVAARPCEKLADIARSSMLALADYFGLRPARGFLRSSDLGVAGRSSERLLGLCQAVGADAYVTGHGARNYLDHGLFDAAGIAVEYMDYRCVPYPQAHGPFTPYVSALDLVANCGPAGRDRICSGTKPWKEFLNAPE